MFYYARLKQKVFTISDYLWLLISYQKMMRFPFWGLWVQCSFSSLSVSYTCLTIVLNCLTSKTLSYQSKYYSNLGKNLNTKKTKSFPCCEKPHERNRSEMVVELVVTCTNVFVNCYISIIGGSRTWNAYNGGVTPNFNDKVLCRGLCRALNWSCIYLVTMRTARKYNIKIKDLSLKPIFYTIKL